MCVSDSVSVITWEVCIVLGRECRMVKGWGIGVGAPLNSSCLLIKPYSSYSMCVLQVCVCTCVCVCVCVGWSHYVLIIQMFYFL